MLPVNCSFMQRIVHCLLGFLVVFSCAGADRRANGVSDKVEQISVEVCKQFIPDKRIGIFDVEYHMVDKKLVVKGVTTSSDAKHMLLDKLTQAGYKINNHLKLLPDAKELDGKIYGVVNLSVCNLHIDGDYSSEMVTQGLLGMPVKILQHDGWYRIQMPDRYIAWVHRVGITPMTKEEYMAWNRADKIVVTSHYGFTYETPDSGSQSVSDVVAGDRLKWEGSEKGYYKVSYPDGRKAYIARTICKPEKEWRASLKQDASSIIGTAKTLLGIPYLWAGTSSKGIDCSGLVRTVLFMHDIIIPRDASQQAYVGEHIDIVPDFSNLQPGDLIFFGRKATVDKKERVVHVAIYIGNKKFIHSQGDVRINSFNPEDEDYDEYNVNRLLFATRILHSIDNPGINTTVTNPFYLSQ